MPAASSEARERALRFEASYEPYMVAVWSMECESPRKCPASWVTMDWRSTSMASSEVVKLTPNELISTSASRMCPVAAWNVRVVSASVDPGLGCGQSESRSIHTLAFGAVRLYSGWLQTMGP